MRRIFFALVLAWTGSSCASASPAQGLLAKRSIFAPTSVFAEALATPSGCELYYTLQPFDWGVLQLLGTPVAPSSRTLFTNPGYIQLRNWDFPSKVTPWPDRPSPQEIEKRKQELIAASSAAAGNKGKPKNASATEEWIAAPYTFEPFSAKDWSELEKWFAKEGPKKISGLCVNREQSGYVLAVGLILEGAAGGSSDSASARIQYDQSTRAADTAVGPNSGTVTVGGSSRPAQELSGMGGNSSRPGTHTCVYLFRTKEPGGARSETPEDYYCQSSDEVPRATITAMLKYLARSK
jgi:hypothetical protein